MADIIEVIADDHRRIRLLREALHAAAAGQDGNPAAGDTLASAWDSLAGLIELHLRGQDEICLRSAAGIEPGGEPGTGERMRAAADVHDGIREAVADARLQPAGSGPWWQAVKAALSIWTVQLDQRQQAIFPGPGRGPDGAPRDRLGRRWLAFRAGMLLDLSSRAAPGAPVCQFCQGPIPVSHRHVLAAQERAVFCACPACSDLFHRDIGSGSGRS
jgi:hypothetical protein